MEDIIVIGILVLCVIAAVTAYIMRKKSGKGCCGSSCAGCSGHCKK